MTYGLQRAGIEVIAGIDIDNACRDTYELNNPKSHFIHSDITQYSCQSLANDTGIKKNDNRLVFVGCSPCQYWSLLKSDKSKSKKTAYLLDHFQDFVHHFHPGYVVVENVPGILKKKNSPLERFFQFLETRGYQHRVDGIVNANDYGVAQNRQRFLLIASRVAPVSTPRPKRGKKPVLKDVIGEHKGFAPILAGTIDSTYRQHSAAALSETNLKRIQITPKDGGTRHAWKDDQSLQLKAYRGKDDAFGDVYGRMFWDKPSPTITTRFISLSNGRFGHPEENRAISIREGARLQSFPKSYKFKTTGLQATARIIGNAVPPLMSAAIGKSILESFNGQID